MEAQFGFAASGSISASTVDRATVEALLHASDGAVIYMTLMVSAVVAAASTATVLLAGVKHPIPVYFLLVLEVAAALPLALTWRRDSSRARALRSKLENSGLTITMAAVDAGGTTGSPTTGYIPELPTASIGLPTVIAAPAAKPLIGYRLLGR